MNLIHQKYQKHFLKILYYHDSLLYNQIELWNLLVSFSILFLPKVPNFGEFQNEYENQDLIFRVTTDLGFQIHVELWREGSVEWNSFRTLTIKRDDSQFDLELSN